MFINKFISSCCHGEVCIHCKRPAECKVEETIFHDDPNQYKHPITAYLCKLCFYKVMNIKVSESQYLPFPVEAWECEGSCNNCRYQGVGCNNILMPFDNIFEVTIDWED